VVEFNRIAALGAGESGFIATGARSYPVHTEEQFDASTLRGLLCCIAAVRSQIDVIFDVDMDVPANLMWRNTTL
jgi:hypothetical protein